jgi:hypothetical protein
MLSSFFQAMRILFLVCVLFLGAFIKANNISNLRAGHQVNRALQDQPYAPSTLDTLPADVLSSTYYLEKITTSRRLARLRWKPKLESISEDDELQMANANPSRNKKKVHSTSHSDGVLKLQRQAASPRTILHDFWSRVSQPQNERPPLQSREDSLNRMNNMGTDFNSRVAASLRAIFHDFWSMESQPQNTRPPLQSQKSSPNRMSNMGIALNTRAAASPRTIFPDYWSRVSQPQHYTVQS